MELFEILIFAGIGCGLIGLLMKFWNPRKDPLNIRSGLSIKIEEFVKKFPDFSHFTTEELAVEVHRKYYQDIEFNVFAKRIGLWEESDRIRREKKLAEEELEEAIETKEQRTKRLEKLRKDLNLAQSKLDEKNEEIEDLKSKIHDTDQSDKEEIASLGKQLAKAKRDMQLAQKELRRAKESSADDPELKRKFEQLRENQKKKDEKIRELEKKLKQKEANSSKSDFREPKTWNECAEELGLSGNKFTMTDVTKAYKERMREVHPDKVASMDDDFKKMAENKSKNVNSAYDYFKKYFRDS